MGFLSNIFSADKALDIIKDTGDALVFTAEEKAKMKLKILDHFAPFKVAQRVLSFMFAANFILAFWVGVAINFFAGKEALKEYIELVVAFNLGWIMLAIVSFYFTGGVVDSFKGLKK